MPLPLATNSTCCMKHLPKRGSILQCTPGNTDLEKQQTELTIV